MRSVAVATTLWTLFADPVRANELLMQPGAHYVVATINGADVRLKVALDAHGFVILNKAAARRAKLGRGDNGSVMAIGPVRIKGRGAKRPVTIAGLTTVLPLSWYDKPVDSALDGVISPALLPYDRITLRYTAAAASDQRYNFRVQLSDGDGLHFPAKVGGPYSIAVRFAPTDPLTVAAGAAGSMMADLYGGTLSGDGARSAIGFGVARPVSRLDFAKPVLVGEIPVTALWLRTSDFLGDLALPGRKAAADDEIIVLGSADRQNALYRMTLGQDVLGQCAEAVYQARARLLTLTCH